MDALDRELRERLPGVSAVEPVQTLWSGWGRIVRARLPDQTPVVVKQVRPLHASDTSALRKLHSYRVEEVFYRDVAHRPGLPRLPRPLRIEPGFFVLEDLDAAGFDRRAVGVGSLTDGELDQAIAWLADFHGVLLGDRGDGLWERGTYWHLQTRPDELARMADGPLKRAAGAIDARLRQARFQTLVHGDAKVANAAFGQAGLAFVDFQYTGRGPGVLDVAYLLGSCLDDRTLEREGEHWLSRYLDRLVGYVDPSEVPALVKESRALWPLAWADFERFLAGWAPDHWKRTGFAHRQTERALRELHG